MLDARSGRILRTVPLAGAPVGITVDAPARRVIIANSGNSTVNMLDTVSGRVVHTVAVGAYPVAVALDTVNDHAFVTNRSDNTVSVIDARRGAVLRTVAVGQSPTSVAVDTRTARVFVVNSGDGTVSVLDAGTGTPLHTVTVGQDRVQGVSTAANPVDIAVDTRHGWIFILNGSSLTHVPTWGSVSVLNATSGEVRRTIPVGLFPQGEALDEASDHLFVVNQVGNAPRGSAQSWGWIPQGVRPWLAFLAPQSHSTSGTVSVLDISRM
jgi:YVTN family beta-propeller protein